MKILTQHEISKLNNKVPWNTKYIKLDDILDFIMDLPSEKGAEVYNIILKETQEGDI